MYKYSISTILDTCLAARLEVHGLVQGVGFRPFIYRLASEHRLTGWVRNTNMGVVIHIEGEEENLSDFEKNIILRAPEAARIFNIDRKAVELEFFEAFTISKSEILKDHVTEVGPDIAVCEDCLDDLKNQKHRIDYPLINCTNCGPRFSIIEKMPYDRPKTSMKEFEMCPVCHDEYTEVLDRRFHAQPVSCNHCGPKYYTEGKDGIHFAQLLKEAVSAIEKGKCVALKGIGGYQLVADAFNDTAVLSVRKIKNRDSKPFAVMFRNVDAVFKYYKPSHKELELLASWRRPVVILKSKGPFHEIVSSDFDTTGVILPYMPIHYQLFEQLSIDALIFTSCNISDDPLIKDTVDLSNLNQQPELVLSHNRDIVNRVDDSVLFISEEKTRMIRRSRSFTPESIKINTETEGILACGPQMKNTFCIGRKDLALVSQHIGELDSYKTFEFYKEAIDRFTKLYDFQLKEVVCDLHPAYTSTEFAAGLDVPVTHTQHHHAHITSVMAEYGLIETLIGVSFDGTGLGTDDTIWGSEFLVCTPTDFERRSHFEYLSLPGGDKAVKEPWRIAYAWFRKFNGKILACDYVPDYITDAELSLIDHQIDNDINLVLSCSAGRWFDLVAVLTGCCTKTSFDGEAAMRLENLAKSSNDQNCYVGFGDDGDLNLIVSSVLEDLKSGVRKSIVAARFHNTIARITSNRIVRLSKETGIQEVVLSGGVFQNRLLLEKLSQSIIDKGLKLYIPEKVPMNDGGISLGQLYIASHKRLQNVP